MLRRSAGAVREFMELCPGLRLLLLSQKLHAGQIVQQLVAGIRDVTEIVGQIHTASDQQRAGLSKVAWKAPTPRPGLPASAAHLRQALARCGAARNTPWHLPGLTGISQPARSCG